jgi:hypothetical protein
MTIHYVPNDPLSTWPNPDRMRTQTPRPDPPSGKAGFWYHDLVDEARYPFGTPEFLFWQCSESALAALEMLAEVDAPLGRWAQGKQRIDLNQDRGDDLNAYYDRSSVSFFHHQNGSKTTWSGASQDVVAHEVGHAILDALRPDFWSSFTFEVNALHEGFGDIVAVLTALHDRKTREALLNESPDLWKRNFVEGTAEDLSDGILRELGPGHNAALPRRAFNEHQWALPSSLPTNGGPKVLINEIHSFGQIISGCFWDTVGNIYNLAGNGGQAGLWKAARAAGAILIEAIRNVPEVPRFTRSLGEAMLAADQSLNGGANEQAIREAFAFHNVTLGASILEPTLALAGTGATAASGSVRLGAAARRDLLGHIEPVRGSKLRTHTRRVMGRAVTEVVHERPVPLGHLSDSLSGVVAMAHEPVLVGRERGRMAVLGAVPNASATVAEVESFVASLLAHGSIDTGKGKAKGKGRGKVRGAVAKPTTPNGAPTHAVHRRGGRKVLERVRFTCGRR